MFLPTLNKETDLGKSFDDLISSIFTRYRGCLIESGKDGFKVFGNWYPSMQEAEKVIDESFNNLQNSITY